MTLTRLRVRQRLLEVTEDVVRVLQAHGQPEDPGTGPGLGRNGSVREPSGVLDERVDAAERDGVRDELNVLGHHRRGEIAPGELESQDRARTALLAADETQRVALRKRRVPHPRDARVGP